MNEKEIAETKVVPYLEKLGWPKQLITQYGKVPVQMGTEVKWADIVVLFVDENDSAIPYLVIEVKTGLANLHEILAQTDSYSKLLDAQYFVITDGENHLFYQRRPAGGYIKINNIPIPDKTHLTVTEQTRFKAGFILCSKPSIEATKQTTPYRELEKKIDDYFGLMEEGKYYWGKSRRYTLRHDITSHYRCIEWIHHMVHDDTDSLTPNKFIDNFENYIMCYRPPNKNRIYSDAHNKFVKVKSFLKYIRDFKGDPEENLSHLFDSTDELHIDGMGPFIISQFLAGAHPKEYTVIEDRMVNTMKNLNLIDTKVKSGTPKGYLYINEICKKLLNEVFRKKIEENKHRLGFKINEDFGLVLIHEFFWEYEEFGSYDSKELEEAIGEERKREEAETSCNLAELDELI